MSVERVNKACAYYPCHDKLEDCTFCFCPLYPCENKNRGKFLKGPVLIWDCSKCTYIHEKAVVDKLLNDIKKYHDDTP